MTDANTQNAAPIRSDFIIVGLVAALVLGGLLYLFSQQKQELRRSPVGFDGLQVWLAGNEGSAQNFTGGWLLDPASVGLLVLPVFDTIPDRDLDPAQDKMEMLFQQDESDLDWWALEEKIDTVPTLVVLPKWRSGMRLTGIAHPALLVEDARLNQFLQTLTGDSTIRLSRIRQVCPTGRKPEAIFRPNFMPRSCSTGPLASRSSGEGLKRCWPLARLRGRTGLSSSCLIRTF
jgi:hypothetical protein